MKKKLLDVLERILIFFARLVLMRHRPKIIAITGSAGKTTAKYTIGSVLKAGFGENKVRAGFGNLGTASGIPLAILGFKIEDIRAIDWLYLFPQFIYRAIKSLFSRQFPKYLVLEVAADKPGDIEKTASYLNPLVVAVTNIGPVHLEFFHSTDNLAKEKGRLIRAVSGNGLVVLNKDDKYANFLESYSLAKVKKIPGGTFFSQSVAKTIGVWLGIDREKIARGLNSVVPPKGRFDIYPGVNGSTIIDSSYNANPVSMLFALERLKDEFQGGARTIAVLGDMLELGKDSENLHRQVGVKAKKSVDYLVAIGKFSKAMPTDFYAPSAELAADHLLNLVKQGDTILVKASHGMHLEKVVEKLKRKD